MKIRNSFVSNSSSASFIIHWRVRTYGEDISVKKAIGRIFQVDYDEGISGSIWGKDKYAKSMTNIEKNTVKNSDGSFTSSFFTHMFNDYEDFGLDAMILSTALVADDDFQIIDSKIDGDDLSTTT